VSERARDRTLDADGPAAPPRRNGELAFDAPWESRLFGLTLALHERGEFEWEEFRARLIEAIARFEREQERRRDTAAPYRYWDRWLEAFERLLADKGWCAPAALEERVRALAAREPGHDHRQPG
jgi:nitrile hydratase accessory protein